MAGHAVVQGTVLALRREIARITGAAPLGAANDPASPGERLVTFSPLDEALGGGLPRASLLEIHASVERDAGAASGFTFALASLAREAKGKPLLWIGTTDAVHEGGLPYGPGLSRGFGLPDGSLLVATLPKISDALRLAEEAAALGEGLCAVILAVRGRSRALDLSATRRLHLRAKEAGRPLFLLRLGVPPEPTAAPVRLVVGPAPALPRLVLGRPLEGSLGAPAFRVRLGKGEARGITEWVLAWSFDEHRFSPVAAGNSLPQDPGAVVSPPGRRARVAGAAGAVLAFDARVAAARDELEDGEPLDDPLMRRSG